MSRKKPRKYRPPERHINKTGYTSPEETTFEEIKGEEKVPETTFEEMPDSEGCFFETSSSTSEVEEAIYSKIEETPMEKNPSEMTAEEFAAAAGLEESEPTGELSLPVGSMFLAGILGAGIASYPMLEKGVTGGGLLKAATAGVVSAGLELLIERNSQAVSNNTAARYVSAAVVGGTIGGAVVAVEKWSSTSTEKPLMSFPISEQPITDE